jgi:hypothetical protein
LDRLALLAHPLPFSGRKRAELKSLLVDYAPC